MYGVDCESARTLRLHASQSRRAEHSRRACERRARRTFGGASDLRTTVRPSRTRPGRRRARQPLAPRSSARTVATGVSAGGVYGAGR
eukprot:5599494-Pleurochrysis_carterae.AAC.8